LSANEHLRDAISLADKMHDEMDCWALERLNWLLWKVARGDSERLLNFSIHKKFLDPMKSQWDAWKSELDADPLLRRHFLQSTLATSGVLSNVAPLVRLGPKTMIPCLLSAAVFALAIEVATRKGTRPLYLGLGEHADERVRNLRHGTEDAHLLGLQLVEHRRLLRAFGDIEWPGGYALLAGTEASVMELIKHGNTIGKPDLNERIVRANDRDYSHVTILTCDPGFCEALELGPDRLARYIVEVSKQQTQANEDAMSRSILRRIAKPLERP
jgi:hypothetical protein